LQHFIFLSIEISGRAFLFWPLRTVEAGREVKMHLVATLIYWVIVALWLGVLGAVLIYYRRNPQIFGTTRLLLFVVALDTCRNIVENIYFGLFFGSGYGFFPARIAGVLGNPALLLIPKLFNVAAGCFVIGVLLMRWLPKAVLERGNSERLSASIELQATVDGLKAEAKIHHMTMHDGLTNLPNRLLFREKIENRLADLSRDQKFAVFCLDLDRFKSVNDTLGHRLGDKLLQQVAVRMNECMREGDILARLGGDEFAILQGGVKQPNDAITLADRLIQTVSAQFDLDGHQAVVGVSLGITIAPTDTADPDQLLKNADMAMFRAKSEGRGSYRFFEAEMDRLLQGRRALELDLRKALVNGEFELYYQPLVNLAKQKITGFEAIIRWNHPERGLIAPLDFIPLAEETTLIVPIGEWVLRQACAEAMKWPGQLAVAVNLSPAQFRMRNPSQMVISALAQSGLPAQRLELEITESVLLADNAATLEILHQLRILGVRIAMDDFGTGYSSLSYLQSFPFDKIKIDRSFVHNLASNKNSTAIIRAVTALGNSLGMTTTGEGVETQEELECLLEEGCTEAQGYFFSKPIPAREVLTLLSEQRAFAKAAA
jgi:diguanylate cyclase (GGDEF)-like protein